MRCCVDQPAVAGRSPALPRHRKSEVKVVALDEAVRDAGQAELPMQLCRHARLADAGATSDEQRLSRTGHQASFYPAAKRMRRLPKKRMRLRIRAGRAAGLSAEIIVDAAAADAPRKSGPRQKYACAQCDHGGMSAAAWYVEFAAREARGVSPIYERLSLAISHDDELLALLGTLAAAKQQPNLRVGVVRFLGGPARIQRRSMTSRS